MVAIRISDINERATAGRVANETIKRYDVGAAEARGNVLKLPARRRIVGYVDESATVANHIVFLTLCHKLFFLLRIGDCRAENKLEIFTSVLGITPGCYSLILDYDRRRASRQERPAVKRIRVDDVARDRIPRDRNKFFHSLE